MIDAVDVSGPHQSQSVLTAGAALDNARVALVLLHGRGASARSILGLGAELGLSDVAYVAPQAARRTWYPQSFMAPIKANEPHLSSALEVVGAVVDALAADGFGPERVVLLGFSQGACLATEYAARHARRYGGVVGLSGGLIGPEETTFDYDGTLDGTPVFLGCSDQDPHIPLERVQETADVLKVLGARVDQRTYEGMGHTVNDDELSAVRQLLAQLRRTTGASAPAEADDPGDEDADPEDAGDEDFDTEPSGPSADDREYGGYVDDD
jgi:predicted esterase